MFTMAVTELETEGLEVVETFFLSIDMPSNISSALEIQSASYEAVDR